MCTIPPIVFALKFAIHKIFSGSRDMNREIYLCKVISMKNFYSPFNGE